MCMWLRWQSEKGSGQWSVVGGQWSVKTIFGRIRIGARLLSRAALIIGFSLLRSLLVHPERLKARVLVGFCGTAEQSAEKGPKLVIRHFLEPRFNNLEVLFDSKSPRSYCRGSF